MKRIYFGDGVNKDLKKIIKFTSSFAYRAFPKLTLNASYKVLTNPFGKRDVIFQSLRPSEEFQTSTDLGNIHVYKFLGGDKHILLVHGWADNVSCFMELINSLLKEGYTVWAFDQIGHGKSDGNRSHLFGFIDGLHSVINEINIRGHELHGILAHSMGGASVLNLEQDRLDHLKVILISMPAEFFEDLFHKLESIGLSKSVLHGLLEDVSKDYDKSWKDLHPRNHREKTGEHILFIHDKDDRFCKYNHVKNYLETSSSKLHTTTGLGHRRILRDNNVIEEVLGFLKD